MEETQGDSGQKPSDAKGDWNQLVGAASEHAMERKEAMAMAEPPQKKKSQGVVLAVLSVLLLAVCSWNFYYFFLSGDPSPEFEATALQASVFIAQQAGESIREETGSLPPSLDEAGADEEGLEYTVSATGYVLTATGEHHAFTYTEGGDLTPFEAAFRSLLSGEVKR